MKRQPRILAGTAIGLLMASAPLGAFPLSGKATRYSRIAPLILAQAECRGRKLPAEAGRSQQQEQQAPAEEQAPAEQSLRPPNRSRRRNPSHPSPARSPAGSPRLSQQPQPEAARRGGACRAAASSRAAGAGTEPPAG